MHETDALMNALNLLLLFGDVRNLVPLDKIIY